MIINDVKPIVQLDNVSIYQKGKTVFDKLNLVIYPGDFCYLVGKTGSGKSSLLKTLYGAKKLEKGKGTVIEKGLEDLDYSSIPSFRRKIGMVFQDFLLFEEWTVADNLSYVLKATDWKDNKAIADRINEILHDVDLFDKREISVAELSGGEKQRLAIGRAILNNPALLIADEPTGNLDPESADKILYLLRNLTKSKGMATIFATHDFRVIEKFPARVYTAENGRLIEK